MFKGFGFGDGGRDTHTETHASNENVETKDTFCQGRSGCENRTKITTCRKAEWSGKWLCDDCYGLGN